MKIAIISDYHISTKWIGDLSIAEQSKKLADRLVDYCRNNDIHNLFIAGDIIDKAIDRPEILHTVNYIFRKFSEYFKNTYYILGQHDLAVNPVGEVRSVDSMITALEYPNIHYANKAILKLGNTKIGMANFSRDSSYKLPEYVDLYITHFTISNRFGQSIDNTKFGTMIAGDIHHKVDIENMHSIGSFQQLSVSKDSEWNNVCIFDCDTKEFEHINLGGGLILRNSEIYSGLVGDIWYELKRTPQLQGNTPIVDKFKDDNYLAIIKKVEEFMREKQLEDVNKEVISQIEDLHNFSTEFTIKYFKVHNFRKIRDFEVTFGIGDKVLLTGKNGSGKSTFLISLFAALTGNLTWSSVCGNFDSEVYTEIQIEYLGVEYYLRRGSGYQCLKCNGSEIPYKNRNDFGGVVAGKLPFLQDLGILFQRPEVGTLFEGVSPNNKLNLISKVYHLEYLDQLYVTGDKIKQNYIKKIKELSYNISQLDVRINRLKEEFAPLAGMSEVNVTELKSQLDGLVDKQSKSENYRKASECAVKLDADIDANRNLIESNNKTLNGLDALSVTQTMNKLEALTKSKNDLEIYETQHRDKLKKLNEVKIELTALRSSKCPRCNQVWVTDSAKLELSKLEESERNLQSEIDALDVQINNIKASNPQFELIPQYKSQIDTYTTTVNSCNKTIDNCNKEINRLTEERKNLNVPEKVEFTAEDLGNLMELKDRISKYADYVRVSTDLKDTSASHQSQSTELEDYQKKLKEISDYVWYVYKSGPIYKSILESLCEVWSNDKVKFSLFEGTWKGQTYLDIKISYLKDTDWQDYSQSSSGEKSYMDILFIKSVTANAGFLILDEFLRHMDDDVHVRAIDEIEKLNVNLFILSSFNPNLYFANRRIYAQYIPECKECRLTVE